MQGRNDPQLLRDIVRGDHGALGALYDRYAPRLFGVALHLLGDSSDAEDLIHDVFLEVWERARSFDPERGPVSSWLVVRVRSRGLDRLRKRRTIRRLFRGVAEHSATGAGPVGALDGDPSHVPDHLSARRAMAALSEDQRRVVELVYFAGLSFREIGETCDIPATTAKSRMKAAITALRRDLGVQVEIG